jgi:transcriptional regulator with XRE-family HTH domain
MKDDVLISFGKRVRELRIASELSQEQLAEKLGFHRTYVGMVERGERNISLRNIKRVAIFFSLSLEELFKNVV